MAGDGSKGLIAGDTKESGNRSTAAEPQVLVEEKGLARILTLNRPRQLNALSSQMVSQLLELFIAYADDPNVKLLIMKGKGRAFCAGGDVAAVVNSISQGHWTLGAKFFWNEFILNYIIATYNKPQVSIFNGIVMGGGAGVSIHGRFRVATENSVFAMPETALGLFPDIGSSYFLSRLPGYFGEYVGLTGSKLDGAEMLACGLATHFVPSTRLTLLEDMLVKVESSDPFAVCTIIDQFSRRVPLKESSAYNKLNIIDKCFSKQSVEEILSALEEEAVTRADEWLAAAIQSLKKASPTSLKICLRSVTLNDMRIADIPIQPNVKLHHLVGQLVYLFISRRNNSHVVGTLNQFVVTSRSTHYATLLCVLRYLRGSVTQPMFFLACSSLQLQLRVDNDADYVGAPTTRKSTTGLCIFLETSLISWKSKKQVVLSLRHGR